VFAAVAVLSTKAADDAAQGPPRRPLLKAYRPASRRALAAPKILCSPQGVHKLSVSLHVQWGENVLDRLTEDGSRVRDQVRTRTYNGHLVGDTICVRPGDMLKVKLVNDLPKPKTGAPNPGPNFPNGYDNTNLHTHGLHVSPEGRSDNVYLDIGPGESIDLCFDIPDTHPAGTFWYHAHRHGSTALQLSSGMAGALIVRGGIDDIPEVKKAMADGREKILVFQQILYQMNDQNVGEVVPGRVYDKFPPETLRAGAAHGDFFDKTIINGVHVPEWTIRPGEVQRWRCIHAGAFRSLNLALVDSKVNSKRLCLHEIAADGLPLRRMMDRYSIEFHPGYRTDFLVKAPDEPGQYDLISLESAPNRSIRSKSTRPEPLARVIVAGAPFRMKLPDPDSLRPFALAPISDQELAAGVPRRFEFRADNPSFTINGMEFDKDRIDVCPRLGTAEEWVLTSTLEAHPFHIHVNPFEVIEKDNAGKITNRVWKDTYLLSPEKDPDTGKPKLVYIRSRFQTFAGKTVLHCHNLPHEDEGMMMAVDIRGKSPPSRCPPQGGNDQRREPTKAPAWELRDPQNRAHASAALAGRPVLLIFFRGFGCSHCRRQLVALAQRREDLAALNVSVAAICPDSSEDMRRCLSGRAADYLPFLLLSDESLGSFRAFGCHDGRALHGTFLIGADGIIHWRHVGDEPYMDVEQVLSECRSLVKPAAAADASAASARRNDGRGNDKPIVINVSGTGGQSKYIKEGDSEQRPVTVTVGQTVRWVNKSDAAHSATQGSPGDTVHLFDTGILQPMGRAERQFTEKLFTAAGGEPGGEVTLLYYCRKHPSSMREAKIILRDTRKKRPNAEARPRNLLIEPSETPHRTKVPRFVEPFPGQDGRWATLPYHMPINPVHVALMRTGKVLIVAGSGNDPANTNFQAAVWDPRGLTVRTFKVSWDMFCNGMVILPDGRPFVIGGNLQYDPFRGLPKTATFDPVAETFADAPDMGPNQGRWYPTATVLRDGSVLVSSGFDNIQDEHMNMSVQLWTGTAWAAAGTAFPKIRLYPRQHWLPDGRVFFSGAHPDSQLYDPATKAFMPVANTIRKSVRDYGTSVLLPLTLKNHYRPTVMIMGGHDPSIDPDRATDTTELIDLAVPAPKWVTGPAMIKARTQMNATILPDGTILTSGGSAINEKEATAVKEAQLYDASSNTFRPASSMEFPRLYHSNTLLLPDATVVAVGGNPERKKYQPEIEVYSPPYLFKPDGSPAARPMISSVSSDHVKYGEQFTVNMPVAEEIKSVVLIRPGAVTHAFDMEQRLVELTFTTLGRALRARAPANGNLAPPGYYLLFILNKAGVPSVAQFVHLSQGRMRK
jgi:FtsP/CotA-like multicopper oxidase with cupredoxin domain/peroxiredoxin/plastocyanin